MALSAFLLLLLLGAAVGTFGTLVGAGGGFILTPILLLVYPSDSPETITAISLAVVFFNAGSGSLAYARQRRIDYRSGVAFALATLPGSVAGALLSSAAPRRLFDGLMALILAALAAWLVSARRRDSHDGGEKAGTLRELTDRQGETHRYRVPVGRGVLYSVGIGFISSFLGIGGGVIHVPLLVRALGFPVHLATATSHFLLAIMAAVGTITHLAAGSFAHGEGLGRTAALAIGVVVGAQLGARLSQRVGGGLIQRLLAVALIALAARLLIAAV